MKCDACGTNHHRELHEHKMLVINPVDPHYIEERDYFGIVKRYILFYGNSYTELKTYHLCDWCIESIQNNPHTPILPRLAPVKYPHHNGKDFTQHTGAICGPSWMSNHKGEHRDFKPQIKIKEIEKWKKNKRTG